MRFSRERHSTLYDLLLDCANDSIYCPNEQNSAGSINFLNLCNCTLINLLFHRLVHFRPLRILGPHASTYYSWLSYKAHLRRVLAPHGPQRLQLPLRPPPLPHQLEEYQPARTHLLAHTPLTLVRSEERRGHPHSLQVTAVGNRHYTRGVEWEGTLRRDVFLPLEEDHVARYSLRGSLHKMHLRSARVRYR